MTRHHATGSGLALGSQCVAALAAMATIVASSTPSWAVAVPDSAQMDGIRAASARASVLLVRGDLGLREIHNAIVDSTGVRSASWESASKARPAVFTSAGAPSPPVQAPIAWSQISSLQTEHQQKTKYALFGFVTGIAAGMLIYGMSDASAETGEFSEAEAWALSAPGLGAFGGFLIGAFTGTRTVYPPKPSQENP